MKRAERVMKRDMTYNALLLSRDMRIEQISRRIARRFRRSCGIKSAFATAVDAPTSARRGERCENRRWIDVHHVRPRSLGGANTLENLVMLCSAHHRMVHERKETAEDVVN